MTRRAGMLDLSSLPRRVISVGGVSARPFGANILVLFRRFFEHNFFSIHSFEASSGYFLD